MDVASWFVRYREAAKRTDQLAENPKHVDLLAAGLFGETGSILAELKKKGREDAAYPVDSERLGEEVGDFLWYFARLTTVLTFNAVKLDVVPEQQRNDDPIGNALALGAAVGALIEALRHNTISDASSELEAVWQALVRVAAGSNICLEDAARKNLKKTNSRWPLERNWVPLFDSEFQEEERIPRKLEVEFRETGSSDKPVVVLRCNGLNVGDRLTDNYGTPDGYRFHDVFHFSYAVYLGWSPILRGLLKCKRKSRPKIDEARTARERASSRRRCRRRCSAEQRMDYYDGIDSVDYDLLKTIQGFVKGFEVDRVPLWQWEEAILNGYRVFRELREHRGGLVILDLVERKLLYETSGTDSGRAA